MGYISFSGCFQGCSVFCHFFNILVKIYNVTCLQVESCKNRSEFFCPELLRFNIINEIDIINSKPMKSSLENIFFCGLLVEKKFNFFQNFSTYLRTYTPFKLNIFAIILDQINKQLFECSKLNKKRLLQSPPPHVSNMKKIFVLKHLNS